MQRGPDLFELAIVYSRPMCFSMFFRDCALTWNLTNVIRYAWWNIDCQAADTEMLKLKLELEASIGIHDTHAPNNEPVHYASLLSGYVACISQPHQSL